MKVYLYHMISEAPRHQTVENVRRIWKQEKMNESTVISPQFINEDKTG